MTIGGGGDHLGGCIPAEVSVCTGGGGGGDTWQPLSPAFWGQLAHSVFTIQLHTEETLRDTENGWTNLHCEHLHLSLPGNCCSWWEGDSSAQTQQLCPGVQLASMSPTTNNSSLSMFEGHQCQSHILKISWTADSTETPRKALGKEAVVWRRGTCRRGSCNVV